jgi:MerR family transcriptional regulator, light-induced transcriptional regulator
MDTESRESRAHHPIGLVADWTGLSQEVLRVWERRYGAVTPARAPGGQRLYTDEDVERLRLLRRATQGGRAIGGVARLPLAELARLVRDDEDARASGDPPPEDAGLEEEVAEAVALTHQLDADGVEALLRRTAVVGGAPAFLERMVAPFLRAVGDEWHAGRLTPAHEHMATAVVQRVVIGVLGQMMGPEEAPVFLSAGPAGDRHGVGALLAAAVAAAERWRVVYLGPDLPARYIAEASVSSGAQAVGLSVVYVEDRERVIRELREVRARLPASVPLLVGGGGAAALKDDLEHPGTRVMSDLEALRSALRGWSRREAR